MKAPNTKFFLDNIHPNNAAPESGSTGSQDLQAMGSDRYVYEDGLLNLLRKISRGTFNFVSQNKVNSPQLYYPPLAETEAQTKTAADAGTAVLEDTSSRLWLETEKMLHIGSWEYDIAQKKVCCTANSYQLLSAPHETKLQDFLSFLPFFATEDSEMLTNCWNSCLRSGKEAEAIARLRHSPEAAWVKLRFKLLSKDGKPVKVIGTFEDVTATIAEANRLKAEKERAEAASHSKSEVMSLFSHEIRTPLNSIMGLTYLLLQDENLVPEHKKRLHSVHYSAQHLLSLSKNTLDFAKIEAGKFELEIVNFSLKDLLNNLYQSFQTRAFEKNIAFELVLDASTPEEVAGDPIRLTQVLNNLISNAIKFTDTGSVKLLVDVVYQSDNEWVLDFTVEDTGIGIPVESQQLIFESFVQASSTTHQKFGGTGLGLAITKKIVELHKGEIKLNSTEGVGSTFTVRLKYTNAQPALASTPAATEAATQVSDLEGLSVLVIDDDAINNLVLNELLLKWGAVVDTAENGLTAFEKISSHDYDLVLMDLFMPTMGGFDTITLIRQAGLQMPVIALTGTANQEEVCKLLAMGVNDYLIKPFHPQQLYDKLIQVMPAQSV